MDETTSSIIGAVLGGSPWALLLVLGWLYIRLQDRHAQLQESRVVDAQKVAKTLLEMQADHNDTTQLLTKTLHDNTSAISSIREDLRGRR